MYLSFADQYCKALKTIAGTKKPRRKIIIQQFGKPHDHRTKFYNDGKIKEKETSTPDHTDRHIDLVHVRSEGEAVERIEATCIPISRKGEDHLLEDTGT